MSNFDLGPVRGLRPDERDDAPVVSLGEMWNKTWEDAHKASNLDAHLFNYSNAFDGIADRVKAATGEALDNPFRSATARQSVEMLGTFSREAVEGSTLYAQWRQRVQELRAKHADKLDWDDLLEEPGRVAWESMKKAREEADALSQRIGMVAPKDVPLVGGIWGVGAAAALGANLVRHPQYTAAQLAAGFAAQMTSPADAAINLLGFGAGSAAKSIIKNGLRNAAVNLVGQALLSAPKQLSYQSAGLPYGWQVWADEVGAAAGAGFMLDAGIRTPARAAIRRFGMDTPAGTTLSRNTERGGILFDAVTDATPAPRPRIEIDPETIRKAEAGDIAASRQILEKTGAIEDPAVKYAVDHMEAGGRLTEDVLNLLEREMGVARPDGMRTLANAMQGLYTDALPEPIRRAPEPLLHERGAAVLDRVEAVSGAVERLPPQVRQMVQDGLDAGIPRIVQAVEQAIEGAPEGVADRIMERVVPLFDERTIAEARLHSGRASPIELAQAIRQFPDLIDSNVDLEARNVAMARSIAGMDDVAYADVARGTIPPEIAALVADRVPKESQARVLGDLQRAEPSTLAEAADLIDAIAPPRRVPGTDGQLAPVRIDDPAGPEAKARTEVLRQEAGQAYADAMEPIQRRDAIEDEIKKLRGQLIKGKREKAPGEAEGGAGEASGPGDIRKQIEALEREHAVLQAQIMPGPEGYELARLAMRAIDMRREADVTAAVNDALRLGAAITPEGTRIEVRPDETMVSRAANGAVAQLDASSDMATGHIQLAVSAMDPAAKIGHEAVHTLVTLGHLSPAEVDALSALAREAGTFTKEAEYRKAYEGRDGLDRIIAEEAAASYIEARIKGDVDGPQNTIVERIRQLLERIRSALARQGFQSREDVVQAILSGEAARREARADWRRNAAQQMRAEDITAAAKSPDGRMFALAGENAKTADLVSLGAAKWMDATGEDRALIWEQTGWFKGVDGRWRFEIDDSQARMSLENIIDFEELPASEAITHDRLFDAYPDMRDMTVIHDPDAGNAYYRDMDEITVGRVPRQRMLLHEMQHAVQTREGMGEGADFDTVGRDAYMRTSSEVEARAVEKRMNMTEAERRARPPWLDYDVPESEQIVRGGEQMFALKPRSAGIPETATSLSSFTRDTEIKADPDYKAAKAGDHAAAGRLAERLVTPEQRARALEVFGSDAVYVPVLAQEASGLNAIPEAVAHVYAASTGAQVAENIVQSSRAFHTGARPLERIISRPTFDGEIVAGKRYVIVDDVTVMGGTLAELANYIREGGGEVAGVVTLANASRTGRIAPDARDIKIIEERFGDLLRDELGVEPRALTADEANYLVNFRDADALRNSISKAGREREKRLLSKGVRAPEADRGPGSDLTLKGGNDPLFALRDPEPPLKADMAFVDRMNRMGELIAACRG